MLQWLGVMVPYALVTAGLWAIWRLYLNERAGTATRVACGVAGLVLGGVLCIVRYAPEPGILVVGAPFAFAIYPGSGHGVATPAPVLLAVMNKIVIAGLVDAAASVVISLRKRTTKASQTV